MELKDRLDQRAKAGLSNPAEVTPLLVDTALLEADEIIAEKVVGDTVRLDIANFRLMLMIKKGGVDDEELDLYEKALKIVEKAPIKGRTESETVPSQMVKVAQRKTSWA